MKYNTEIFKEAKRLHDLGFAVQWLKPRSKMPTEFGWTTGPRKTWEQLQSSYRPGYNLSTRLGTPARLAAGYLAVIDVDVKSTLPEHEQQAMAAAKTLMEGKRCPVVRSGRGNGSRHYYCVTAQPFKTFNTHVSDQTVKYHSPSKEPSKREHELLTPAEIAKGVRLGKAWEISLYSDGRHVVAAPSVHPDSGGAYRWSRPVHRQSDLPLLSFAAPAVAASAEASSVTPSTPKLVGFVVTPVELAWLDISAKVLDGIVKGTGVEDRSGFLLKASSALFSAGLSQNEVLTVLTDPQNFIAGCAYEHAKTKKRERAAEWVFRYTVKRVGEERATVGVFAHVAPTASRRLSKEEMAANQKEFAEARHWTQDILKIKTGQPQKLLQNVFLIVSNAVGADVVRRDLFCYRDSYTCTTPWGGKASEVVSDDDIDEAQLWLGKQYQFEPPKNLIESALIVIARQNAYDPVKDMIEGLPAWDGVPRLDTWLADNFGATGEAEYLAQVFRKWMVAMIMRVYKPGAKFDWMPIFEGVQGIGKSSFGRILVGDTYFLDWLPNLNDKDAALSLQGMWGVELGELSQFRRNELESIKAFITRTVDKMRPPYGKRLIESPRRCVFFGTTNRKTYLIDETGNRRFKPVEVGALNFKALRRDRLQLFAEAKHLWTSQTETEITLELTGAARIYEAHLHNEKMVEDDSNAMEESMRGFIQRVQNGDAVFNLENFKILELFEGAGPLGGWRKENKNMQFAAKMLKKLGFEMRRIHGFRVWKMGQYSPGCQVLAGPHHPDEDFL